jgi:hypothetical protein
MTTGDALLHIDTFICRGADIPCTPLTWASYLFATINAGLTGGRRGMMLRLEYSQVQVVSLRDKKSGRHIIAIGITMNRNKTKESDKLTRSRKTERYFPHYLY